MFKLKKAVAILLVAMMTIATFAGCAKKQEKLDESAVLMTVEGREVTVGMINFYTRYQQSLMESVYQSYLGENVWRQEVENGVTYEESTKDAILEQLQELYIIASHTSDYEVSLTENEKTVIAKTAQEFEDANSKSAKSQASAVKAYAEEYLELVTIKDKMKDAMKKDIDTEVDEKEYTQKRLRFVEFSSDDAKKEAEACLKGAKENGSLEAYATEKEITSEALTFDKDTTTLGEDIIKAADKLEANEFAEVMKADDKYYVVQLESTYDSDATASKIKNVLETRGQEKYDELVKEWKDKAKIDVDEELWDKISFNTLKVNSITPEAEETTDESTEQTTDETTTDTTEGTDATDATEGTDAEVENKTEE